jgi:hypothetical protein
MEVAMADAAGQGHVAGKVPIIGSAVTAWGDAFRAIAAMPVLVGTVFVILLLISGANMLLMPDMEKMVATQMPLWIKIVSIINNMLTSLLMAPLAIAVHRMVLLGETTERYNLNLSNSRFRRFVGFGIIIGLFWSVPNLILWFAQGSGTLLVVTSIVSLILQIVIAIVTLRRVILFPAIAVDALGATWSNARNDTKGHSWRVLFVLFCTLLPMTIVTTPLFFTLMMPPRHRRVVCACRRGVAPVQGLCLAADGSAGQRVSHDHASGSIILFAWDWILTVWAFARLAAGRDRGHKRQEIAQGLEQHAAFTVQFGAGGLGTALRVKFIRKSPPRDGAALR